MNNEPKLEHNTFAVVPEKQRQHWLVPTMIFGGLEFCIPVIMMGAVLVGHFSIFETLFIIAIGLVLIQWPGNAIQGYIGAKTGLSSPDLIQKSFGPQQSRFIIEIIIAFMNIGWWAIQTSVVSNAVSTMFGIDYHTQVLASIGLTLVIGLLFALPSVLGYTSMKWTDFVALPAGLLLVIVSLYLAFQNLGWSQISAWNPTGTLGFTEAINLVVGMNVAQWVIAADYTRFAKAKIKDQLLIPLGIVAIGLPLMMVGGIMSVGVGNPDIVEVMVNLGFPAWGFILLWLATWTSQLVANYSGGLALCHVANVQSERGRAWLTLVMALIGIALALVGILEYFTDFLNLITMILPGIAGVMMFDYLIFKNQNDTVQSWRWEATLSMLIGIAIGFLTTYVIKIGFPAVQSLLATGAVYYFLNKKRS